MSRIVVFEICWAAPHWREDPREYWAKNPFWRERDGLRIISSAALGVHWAIPFPHSQPRPSPQDTDNTSTESVISAFLILANEKLQPGLGGVGAREIWISVHLTGSLQPYLELHPYLGWTAQLLLRLLPFPCDSWGGPSAAVSHVHYRHKGRGSFSRLIPPHFHQSPLSTPYRNNLLYLVSKLF